MEPPAGEDEEVKPEAVTSTAGAGADPGNLGSDESEGLECMGTTEDMIKNSGGKPPPPPRIREGKKGKSGSRPPGRKASPGKGTLGFATLAGPPPPPEYCRSNVSPAGSGARTPGAELTPEEKEELDRIDKTTRGVRRPSRIETEWQDPASRAGLKPNEVRLGPWAVFEKQFLDGARILGTGKAGNSIHRGRYAKVLKWLGTKKFSVEFEDPRPGQEVQIPCATAVDENGHCFKTGMRPLTDVEMLECPEERRRARTRDTRRAKADSTDPQKRPAEKRQLSPAALSKEAGPQVKKTSYVEATELRDDLKHAVNYTSYAHLTATAPPSSDDQAPAEPPVTGVVPNTEEKTGLESQPPETAKKPSVDDQPPPEARPLPPAPAPAPPVGQFPGPSSATLEPPSQVENHRPPPKQTARPSTGSAFGIGRPPPTRGVPPAASAPNLESLSSRVHTQVFDGEFTTRHLAALIALLIDFFQARHTMTPGGALRQLANWVEHQEVVYLNPEEDPANQQDDGPEGPGPGATGDAPDPEDPGGRKPGAPKDG